MMEQHEPENITRLTVFFEMLDTVEEDISQLVSDENKEAAVIGGYECLFIAFGNLLLYCASIGINLRQIEDQYQGLKELPAKEEFGILEVNENLNKNNEVINFCKLLEQIESSLSAFEQRCKNSEELFDEWNCVVIMYSYLRNYCAKEKFDFESLHQEILHLQTETKKVENP